MNGWIIFFQILKLYPWLCNLFCQSHWCHFLFCGFLCATVSSYHSLVSWEFPIPFESLIPCAFHFSFSSPVHVPLQCAWFPFIKFIFVSLWLWVLVISHAAHHNRSDGASLESTSMKFFWISCPTSDALGMEVFIKAGWCTWLYDQDRPNDPLGALRLCKLYRLLYVLHVFYIVMTLLGLWYVVKVFTKHYRIPCILQTEYSVKIVWLFYNQPFPIFAIWTVST